ncbi:MAG TPA: Lpg1974 family pore-forming outer membrane protein [Chlamydiales bacterium]|nr:Lpg1974 family pore-forming outer membrane protein [Chlamydiales bacterium]
MKLEKIACLSLLFCTAAFAQCEDDLYVKSDTNNPRFFQQSKQKPIVNPILYSITYLPEQSWDVDVTADYIFWLWSQDTDLSNGGRISSQNNLDFQLKTALLDPGYASGFQVGAGFHTGPKSDWRICTEYTWYRNSDSLTTNVNVSLPLQPLISGTLLYEVNRDVSLSFDNADFLLQGPLYASKSLTASFLAGLEALFITRKVDLSGFLDLSTSLFDLFELGVDFSNLNSDFKTTSWSLGPKFGFNASWLLGVGLKVLTNVTSSLLYTQYSSNASVDALGSIIFGVPNTIDTELSLALNNLNTLRAASTAYLGLGWGYYFSDDRYHLDLAVGYDFNAYWNFVTDAVRATWLLPATLYLQGLNIKARFDF